MSIHHFPLSELLEKENALSKSRTRWSQCSVASGKEYKNEFDMSGNSRKKTHLPKVKVIYFSLLH
jgi:hypothetical protein